MPLQNVGNIIKTAKFVVVIIVRLESFQCFLPITSTLGGE